MDFDNDITKLDLPADTAYTTVQNIWTAIQEIQLRMRFQQVDLEGSPTLPPVDKVDICLRESDNKLVAVKNDGSIVDIENSPAVSDHGTKVKENGTLVSSSARPLNLSNGSPFNFTEDAFNDHFTLDINVNGIDDAMIAAHTSTKITINNLAQLPSSLLTETNTKTVTNKTLTAALLGEARITSYLEFNKLGGDPSGNPPADKVWMYVDSAEQLVFENDAGSKTVIGGSISLPIAIADGGTGQTSKINAFDALAPTVNNGDMIYRSGGDNIALAPGTDGHILTMVSGLPAWAANAGGGGGGSFDYITTARERVGFIEDFWSVVSKANYTAIVTGTGAAFNGVDVTEAGVYGVGQLTTGTTSGGEAAIIFAAGTGLHGFRLGQGVTTMETLIKIHNLSDGTNTYRLIVGLVDLSTDPSQNEGVWLEYEQSNDPEWRRSTGNDGTKTENASASVVGTAWVRLKIVVNAAGTSAEYFVNGVSIGTETTNIPVAAGDELFPMVGIFKSAGTTARLVSIDYVAFQIALTSQR